MRILVVGGSLAGLAAASALLRAGVDVQVYERTPSPLSGRGAGLVTHRELVQALLSFGIRIEGPLGVAISHRTVLRRDGSVHSQLAAPQIFTSWDRLFRLLREAFPNDRYHLGKRLVRIDQTERQAQAWFDDGSFETADLLIGADGIRSQVRTLCAPEVEPRYAGYVAWRGMAEEVDLSATTVDALFDRMAFCLPEGEQILGYPVAGAAGQTKPGNRRYNFVWYRPADQRTTLRWLLTDAQGKTHDGGIAPHLITDQVRDQMLAAARSSLAPALVEVVEKTPQTFFQPITDLESRRMVFGRALLLGDAAFVSRPHLGMGVTKAYSDAVSLSKALSAHGLAGLAMFERERLAAGGAIVERSRQLGAYMQAQLLTQAERDNAAQFRSPERILSDTAMPDQYWTDARERDWSDLL